MKSTTGTTMVVICAALAMAIWPVAPVCAQGSQLGPSVCRIYDDIRHAAVVDVPAEQLLRQRVVPADMRGDDAARRCLAACLATCADGALVVDAVEAEGNTVTVSWRFTGIHSDPLLGVAATGKQVTVTGTDTAVFACGTVVDEWSTWDMSDLCLQLGLAS